MARQLLKTASNLMRGKGETGKNQKRTVENKNVEEALQLLKSAIILLRGEAETGKKRKRNWENSCSLEEEPSNSSNFSATSMHPTQIITEHPTPEELEAMACVPPPEVKLRTLQTNEEKELLKKIVINVAYPLVKEGKKNWGSRKFWFRILDLYNDEAKQRRQPTDVPMNVINHLSIFLDAARSISWCNCPQNSKNICECIEPHVPYFSYTTNASISSGSSRKRSRESISSEDINDKVAGAIEDLTSNGVITSELGVKAATLYSVMIQKGLLVNANYFCRVAEKKHDPVAVSKHIYADISSFGHLLG